MIIELEEYSHGHGSKGYKNYYETTRCKFLMPKWYIDKYDILHWDNVHMKIGKTWKQHLKETYGEHFRESSRN